MLCLYLVQHLLHQIKAQQFYTDLVLYQQCLVLLKIVEFNDFSTLSDLPVLFKADLIFKDFSRKPSKFKYFPSLCEPCRSFKVRRVLTIKCCWLVGWFDSLPLSQQLSSHAEMVSSPNHTFSWASWTKQFTRSSFTYFRL